MAQTLIEPGTATFVRKDIAEVPITVIVSTPALMDVTTVIWIITVHLAINIMGIMRSTEVGIMEFQSANISV